MAQIAAFNKRIEMFNVAIKALEQTENPSYNSVKTELDCISREEVVKLLEKEDWADTVEGVLALPLVTPKADSWSKLYMWLNDMHLGISPDEFTPDDEKNCRVVQTDIIEDIMEWIEANVFEQKPKEDEE